MPDDGLAMNSTFQAVFTTTDDARRQASSRMSDLFLCALIPLNMAVPGLPVDIPVPELAVMALALLASNRRPDTTRRPRWFAPLVCSMWFALALSAFINDIDGWRRLLHMANFVVLALILSSGRVDRRSAMRGIALGFVITAVSGLANLVVPIFNSGYGDRLTGLLLDPNVAGYYLLVFGCVALAALNAFTPTRRRELMTAVFALMILTVILTFSRTALTALAFGLLWLLLRRLGHPRVALAALAVAAWQFSTYAERLRLWGPFQGREGSDQLRERIEAAEQVLVSQSGLLGNGPGTATVDVLDQSFFFHNSYFGMRAEGGWILTLTFGALVALVLIRLASTRLARRAPWLEMALIAILIIGMSLGEVLLELPVAVVLGLAVRHIMETEEVDTGPAREQVHGVWRVPAS